MKVRRICPSCSGTGILWIEGKICAYGSGNNIITDMTIFSSVLVHRYVCCNADTVKNGSIKWTSRS